MPHADLHRWNQRRTFITALSWACFLSAFVIGVSDSLAGESGIDVPCLSQECDERLLFSYQNDGSILLLGLNIGGYAECDARIDSAQVLDGAWDHCAATFDGQTMRVYPQVESAPRIVRPGPVD